MAIAFNHTIVAARDKRESAQFLSELFGLPAPTPFGH
ncbi:MAG: VOC family protein, partial [Mycobacterium sp.]